MTKLQPLMTLLGFFFIGFSAYYALTHHDATSAGDLSWLHIPSVTFVGLNSLGIMLCSYSFANLTDMFSFMKTYSPARAEKQLLQYEKLLKTLCDIYYSRGSSGLLQYTQKMDNPTIWRKIFDYLEWKIPEKDIIELIKKEAQQTDEKMSQRIQNLQQMAQITPSIGVVGTVMGLMKLLAQMDDPSQIGGSLSLALVTTLYGLLLSVGVFGPLSSRAAEIKSFNRRLFSQALFWMQVIEEKKPSTYCQQRTDR